MGYHIWIDTETTGTDRGNDQILEFAAIVSDENGNEVETIERLVCLKDSVIPSPEALAVNGINPFSKSHKQNSVTEARLVKEIEEIAQKYKNIGKPLKQVSYNGEFDKSFLSVAFTRQGKDIRQSIQKTLIDPMDYAETAINLGKLKTEPNAFGGMSKSAAAVSKALGVKYEGLGAHRALSDVRLMKQITPMLFKMNTGSDFYKNSSFASDAKEKESYSIVKRTFDDKGKESLEKMDILILGKSKSANKVYYVDARDAGGAFNESIIKEIPSKSVVSMEPAPADKANTLINFYGRSQEAADKAVQVKFDNSEVDTESEIFTEETKSFEIIDRVKRRMLSAKNKKSEYDACYKDIQKELDGNKVSAKTIMTKAEKLAESQGYRGWSRGIFGIKNIEILSKESESGGIRVAMHPEGKYWVELSHGDGRFVKEKFSDKKSIMALINESEIEEKDEFMNFVDKLPSKASFSNKNHPSVLSDSLKRALDRIKAKKASPTAGTAIASLIEYLKLLSPQFYSKFDSKGSDFDPDFSEVYKEYQDEDISNAYQLPLKGMLKITETTETEEEQSDDNVVPFRDSSQMNFEDHLGEGDDGSSARCSVCSRKLNKEVSKRMALGKTCAERLNYVATSSKPPETFTQSMVEIDLKRLRKIGVGETSVIRTASGQTFLAEGLRVMLDGSAHFTDKKEFKKLLEMGHHPSEATFLAAVTVPAKDITHQGRLSTKIILEERKVS